MNEVYESTPVFKSIRSLSGFGVNFPTTLMSAAHTSMYKDDLHNFLYNISKVFLAASSSEAAAMAGCFVTIFYNQSKTLKG